MKQVRDPSISGNKVSQIPMRWRTTSLEKSRQLVIRFIFLFDTVKTSMKVNLAQEVEDNTMRLT